MTSNPVRVMDFRGTYKGGGGPDKTILNSAAQHNPNRVHVLVTYLRQPEDKEYQIAEMAKILGINYLDIVDHRILDWGCIRQLKRIIQREKISLLHSHDDKTLLYSVILKCFVPGLRLMHTCHSHSEYLKESFQNIWTYWKFSIRKKILIGLMRSHMYPILTISENTKSRLVRSGLAKEHVSVIYNGVDIDYWHSKKASPVLKKELELNDDDLLVGTVARISYDKDFPTFYAVAGKVNRQMPKVKFVIVGDGYGDELQQAKNDVRAIGLEGVIYFTGHRTDLVDIYTSFDIFLMTSLTEGLPNTLLEAMALEIPVVSTQVGGVAEVVVHNQTGLLSSIKNSQGLCQQVVQLLQDDTITKKYGQAARRRIEEKFSFSQRVRKMEDIYEDFTA